MTQPRRLNVTKIGLEGEGVSSKGSVPPFLIAQAVTRLRIVAIGMIVVMAISWPLGVQGRWAEELQEFFQWAPPVLAIVASLLVVVATRNSRLSGSSLVSVGLVYQVVVSYAIVLSSYWNTFEGVAPGAITADFIGLSPTALWMLFFTVLVPARPHRALMALLGSASAVPVTYLLLVRVNDAPPLGVGQFLGTMVYPYLVVTVTAYIAARIIYRLGQDIRDAREMGSYRLEERLGEGGMGEVWRASHRLLARPAAIKLIRRDAFGSDPTAVATATERFEREAQATASLRSPHTVELYDFGTADDGTLYYVMELLHGIDLDHMVRQFGPLEPARVIHLVRQACASLAEAHEAGLIHRDIKPANLYVCKQGLEHDVLKVLDFGLVRKQSSVVADDDTALSRIGTVLGTPTVMAPEMVVGSDVDGRVDLYALGCVAYWMLTGRNVFEADAVRDLLFAHVREDPVPPSHHAPHPLPPGLDAVVLRCLAKEPDDRFSTASELAAELGVNEAAAQWSGARAAEWWRENM